MHLDSEAWSTRPGGPVQLVLGVAHRLEPLGQRQGIAVVAPRRHSVATCRRVPGCFCPLDGALVCHLVSLPRSSGRCRDNPRHVMRSSHRLSPVESTPMATVTRTYLVDDLDGSEEEVSTILLSPRV